MENQEYIRPTKQSPIFVATCDYFGYIEEKHYKDYLVEAQDSRTGQTIQLVGRTFATSYANAVNRLHEWIVEHPEVIKDYPKSKFDILLVDGSVDRFDSTNQEKVYTISARKAKRLLF